MPLLTIPTENIREVAHFEIDRMSSITSKTGQTYKVYCYTEKRHKDFVKRLHEAMTKKVAFTFNEYGGGCRWPSQ